MSDKETNALGARTRRYMIEQKHPDAPMSQAEVGGGARVDPEQRLQRPGYLIRDFTLTSMQGSRCNSRTIEDGSILS